MTSEITLGNRFLTRTGLFCVMASLLLGSPGVRAVRAEDAQEVGPVVRRGPAAQFEAAKSVEPAVASMRPPDVVRSPVSTDVIVLDSRGYNYGPRTSPTTEVRLPEASTVESRTR